ncbi:MAG: hypothetical protein FWH23_08230 [Bacteroidales bacterium]|nr:hypothetical protein [Bacteroidales bacterium]
MNTFVKNSNFPQRLKLLPLCLMLLFMVFSCNKEKEDPVLDDIGLAQLPPEIQAAKAWFDQQYASNDQEADSVSLYPVSRASENGKNGKGPNVKAKLKWAQAKLGKDWVVEVPLATTGKISYSREENPSEAQLESTVTQMIIVPREDEYVAAFMHITGDSQYLAAKGYDLSSNAYKDMVEDFTGQVFYTYLDGEYSNGWRYENGEVTHTISYQGAFGVPDIENEAPTRANSDNCIVIIVQEFFQWCTEKYIRDKDGNITDYSLTCDEWKLTGSYEYNQCSTGSGNGSGGGGGKPGAGGGSGGFLGNDDNNPPPATYTVFLELPALDVGIITGGGTYTAGATCELTAIPAAGYSFVNWRWNISSTANPLSFVVDKDYNIGAVFVKTGIAESPCDFLNSLLNDAALANKLDSLRGTAINEDIEYGYSLSALNNGAPVWAQGNASSVFIPTLGYCSEFVHTHPTGLAAMSAQDFYHLFYNFSNGTFDVSSRYGVVVHSGYYFYQISDPQAFINFANKYGLDKGDLTDLNAAMNEDFSILSLSSFIQFLNSNNTGLTMIEGNPNTGEWQVKDFNNNNLTNINCD